jgi:hypothetical protein
MSASEPVMVSDPDPMRKKEPGEGYLLDETTVEYIPGPNIARRSGDMRTML